MKIVVVGTRGIPDIQGGVETHCQELYPRLSKLGCKITVITRKPYVLKENRNSKYFDISLKHLYAPKNKSLEAIVHTFLAIIYARMIGANIIHIHAIGPALLTPFARLLGMRTIVTHHGPDYDRKKWGALAKIVLRTGEALGAKYANEIIVISNVIAKIIESKYHRYDSHIIYNGVTIPQSEKSTEYLDELGIEKGKYVIAIGRFVEEKGFHDLINAWKLLNNQQYRLVIVGDADHETSYSRKIKTEATCNAIVLTGFIKGKKLAQIYSNARLFVLPSYHEGLPIALLEAMSYNLPVLVSNIPANLEVPLEDNNYFNVGNSLELSKKIYDSLQSNDFPCYTELLSLQYNWHLVAEKTYEIYENMIRS